MAKKKKQPDKPDYFISKRDPHAMEKLVSLINTSDERDVLVNKARVAWIMIDRIDRKHADNNYPYSDSEVKQICKKANELMHKSNDLGLEKLSNELFETHTKLYLRPENFSETEKVITINRIKDIIHQIFEPRMTKTEVKKDLTIEGFPRFKSGKKYSEYRKIYEQRIFWFYDVLEESKGKIFADALFTMDHDFNENFLVIAHLAYDEISKLKVLEKAVKTKLITKDGRIKFLEALLYIFAMKILKSPDRDQEETNEKLQKLTFAKYRKLEEKLEKK